MIWRGQVPPPPRPGLGFMLDDEEMLGCLAHLYGPERADAIGREWEILREHGLEGCLWQGRFYSGVVEKDAVVKAVVAAYIGYNPVKASARKAVCATETTDRQERRVPRQRRSILGKGRLRYSWHLALHLQCTNSFPNVDCPRIDNPNGPFCYVRGTLFDEGIESGSARTLYSALKKGEAG